MRVAVNQPGQDSLVRKIDQFRILGAAQLFAHRRNLASRNQNLLIREHGSGIGIDQPPSSDKGNMRVRQCTLWFRWKVLSARRGENRENEKIAKNCTMKRAHKHLRAGTQYTRSAGFETLVDVRSSDC